MKKGPIRYLINTERHIDHIFGNHWFQDAVVIGHEKLLAPNTYWYSPKYDCYDYSVDVINRQDHQALKHMPKREEFNPNPPSLTFSEKMTLALGDHHFQLYHTPGHTAAQIAVYVPEESTVFTGDTLFSSCQTWLQEAGPDQWLESLRFLKTLDAQYYVPGHGPVVGKDYIDTQISVIYEWLTAVSAGISKGWSLEECLARISFADAWPVDIGQEDSMEMVQNSNVTNLYKFLTKNTPEYPMMRRDHFVFASGIRKLPGFPFGQEDKKG